MLAQRPSLLHPYPDALVNRPPNDARVLRLGGLPCRATSPKNAVATVPVVTNDACEGGTPDSYSTSIRQRPQDPENAVRKFLRKEKKEKKRQETGTRPKTRLFFTSLWTLRRVVGRHAARPALLCGHRHGTPFRKKQKKKHTRDSERTHGIDSTRCISPDKHLCGRARAP